MKLSLLSAAAVPSLLLGTASVAAGGCFEDAPFHPDDWKYCQPITPTLFMYYTPLEDTVMLGLHATEDASGWTALGPAGNGGMKGASQIVVRKDESTGEWIAEDRYSMEYTTPSMDEQQDVQLLFAQQDESTGETAWGVVIPQDSCDEPYDYAIEDRSIYMIWAMGSSHDFAFHGNSRGQFTANLMNAPPQDPDLGEYDHVELLMPNVPVVRGEEDLDPTNPFICTYFDMEEIGRERGFDSEDKVHLVGMEPVVTEGNEKLIHHIILYTCDGEARLGQNNAGIDDSELYHQKVIPACTNMPPGCANYVAQWAVGAPSLVVPEDVGIPFGEGARWFVMQTHYYNPELIPDVTDSSGLKIHYTTNLRPMDMGIMRFVVGVATGQHPPIPGGMKDVAMETLYVEPECTKQWTEPLNVIDVAHHSHFMGLHQEIVVEREGRNLGSARKEFRYDYNHQTATEPVSAIKQLLPGDRIAATCHFDTSSVSADSQVSIGEESNKEMCYPTLYYYPKQELEAFYYFDPATISQVLVGQDHTWCFSPPTDDKFASRCHEELYTNVSNFMKNVFDALGIQLPAFSYSNLCNGGLLTAALRNNPFFGWPEFCPDDCDDTQSCTEEMLLPYVQGICETNCNAMGLSVYPDTSRTVPYTSSNMACPQMLFDPPTLSEPETCQVKGSLPQTIELKTVTEGSVSGVTDEPSTGVDKDTPAEAEDTSSAATSTWSTFALVLLAGLVLG